MSCARSAMQQKKINVQVVSLTSWIGDQEKRASYEGGLCEGHEAKGGLSPGSGSFVVHFLPKRHWSLLWKLP